MHKNIENILKKYEVLYNEKLRLIDFSLDVAPCKSDILNAFNLIEGDIKVVILGQDPYYVKGYANGLAFSVNKGVKVPRSLANIYKELKLEYDDFDFIDGDLSLWAKQGVLLLNTCLTTLVGAPLAHKDVKWVEYTSKLINEISKQGNICFILLGGHAQKFSKFIEPTSNLILNSSHPSPLSASRGFFGSNVFIDANKFLQENNIKPINWNLKGESYE